MSPRLENAKNCFIMQSIIGLINTPSAIPMWPNDSASNPSCSTAPSSERLLNCRSNYAPNAFISGAFEQNQLQDNSGWPSKSSRISPADRPLTTTERNTLFEELKDAKARLVCAESLLEVAVESCKDDPKKIAVAIRTHEKGFEIARICRVMRIPRSTFYVT